ncbi:uncharacterized protein LOC122512622 [Leptopilina heterotoma]|uniref:uncharacterized protein LOC122512622 n=1 Tax=Leptopilina heterotoma TaxID=63436 RepID=UPI001CA914B9|nr:uncharacterized protein LOC122512622 [Leptopilina heterotoma]
MTIIINTTNFTSALEYAQIIPIYTYVNIISSFLFVESQLNENDLYKNIPTVNALYKYFEVNKKDLGKKLELVRKILASTDLYGSKSYEDLDETFINTMLEYFVKSLVFQKFNNIYGFLANVTIGIEKPTYISVIEGARLKINEMEFENEYGPKSKLSPLAARRIMMEVIVPMFPVDEEDLEIFSVNYIYAQAGLTFFRSNGRSVSFYSKGNYSEMYLWKHEMNLKIMFEECVEMGHLIEQMTLANKINASALTVFALPAFLYYVNNQRDNMTETICSIMNTQSHWLQAFQLLFTHLESKLNKVKQLMKPTAESEFYQAVSKFKNRSTIARENILKYCLQTEELDQMIENYKNDNNDYYCNNFTNNIKLPDLKELFMQQVENLKQKCYKFEMKKLKEAFGDDFIREMNQANVEIYNGIYITFPESIYPKPPIQILAYPNIAFKCYFPKNDTTEYYALVKEETKLWLIKESDNPVEFRRKLNITIQSFYRSHFIYKYKSVDEKFGTFLQIMASQQVARIGKYLETTGYQETRVEWWKNFGLSLIPFYNCIDSVFDKYQSFAYTSCVIDSLLMFPLVSMYLRTSTAVGRVIALPIQATIQSFVLKVSLQAIVRTFVSYTSEGAERLLAIFDQNFFKHLGYTVIRLLDPGFELVFKIGTMGLLSMKAVLSYLRQEFVFSTSSIEVILAKALVTLNKVVLKVGTKYDRNVYVNSLDGTSGFGFRYLRLEDKNQIAELRNIGSKESPYLLDHISKDNQRVYKELNPITWQVEQTDIIFKEPIEEASSTSTFEINIINDDNLVLCEGGNFLCVGKKKATNRDTEIANLQTIGMDEPELFYELQNAEEFTPKKIKTKEKAKSKFAKLYPNQNSGNRDMSVFAHNMYNQYMMSPAINNLQFEDFVAIRYYGTDGFTLIRDDTDVARRMKNAIYRLAIRQSRDLIEEYIPKLFRGEVRETEEVEKFFYNGRKDMVLTQFTSASEEPSVARIFALTKSQTKTRIMYQMRFDRPYLRAKVKDVMAIRESETILLPGTKFKIDDLRWKFENDRKAGLTVILSYDYESMNLLQSQMNVMSEIKKLQDSETIFYVENLKK